MSRSPLILSGPPFTHGPKHRFLHRRPARRCRRVPRASFVGSSYSGILCAGISGNRTVDRELHQGPLTAETGDREWYRQSWPDAFDAIVRRSTEFEMALFLRTRRGGTRPESDEGTLLCCDDLRHARSLGWLQSPSKNLSQQSPEPWVCQLDKTVRMILYHGHTRRQSWMYSSNCVRHAGKSVPKRPEFTYGQLLLE